MTTPGVMALALPASTGTHVWLVNNSGGTVTITNSLTGSIVLPSGRAQHFLYVPTVSLIDWIPG